MSEQLAHSRVCKYLNVLGIPELRSLGSALGLDFPRLQKMTDLPNEMVTQWLNEADNVKKAPSWDTLVVALKEIGQNGIAAKIKDAEITPTKEERYSGTQSYRSRAGATPVKGITTLPDPTVNNVITFLMKENFPAGDAKKLGMLLDIPPGVLNRFVANNPNNHDGVLMDVITYWNDNDEISWDTLSNTLKKCGQKEMAAKIKEKPDDIQDWNKGPIQHVEKEPRLQTDYAEENKPDKCKSITTEEPTNLAPTETPQSEEEKSSSEKIGAVFIVTNTYSKCKTLIPLEGPHIDGVNLKKAFKALKNFDVYWESDVKKPQMTNNMEKVGKLNTKSLPFNNYRCIIFIFSGHGDDDFVYMEDEEKFLIYEDIIKPLLPENAPGIKTIPKVFLFDACRGDSRTGTIEETKGKKSIEKSLLQKLGENDKIAKEGNILVAYATLPGHMSYGHKDKGGHWLSTLASLLKKDEWYMDSIEVLLTQVSKEMHASMNDDRDKNFLQPVKVSLLNQHICLNLKPVCEEKKEDQGCTMS